ncbi:MAG TPA: hypothetical protein VFP68_05195 [Burkholderiaceae bacterium]|nr:hypothetical protein [Burkholderiaceae bacterium]
MKSTDSFQTPLAYTTPPELIVGQPIPHAKVPMTSLLERPKDPQQRGVQLHLKSTPLVYVLGLLHWACQGYRAAEDTEQPVAPYIKVFAEGYRLGPVLAERLLRAEIPVSSDGVDIVLRLTSEERQAWQLSQVDVSCTRGDSIDIFPSSPALPDLS